MPTINHDQLDEPEEVCYELEPWELESAKAFWEWNAKCQEILLRKIFGERYEEVMGRSR